MIVSRNPKLLTFISNASSVTDKLNAMTAIDQPSNLEAANAVGSGNDGEAASMLLQLSQSTLDSSFVQGLLECIELLQSSGDLSNLFFARGYKELKRAFKSALPSKINGIAPGMAVKCDGGCPTDEGIKMAIQQLKEHGYVTLLEAIPEKDCVALRDISDMLWYHGEMKWTLACRKAKENKENQPFKNSEMYPTEIQGKSRQVPWPKVEKVTEANLLSAWNDLRENWNSTFKVNPKKRSKGDHKPAKKPKNDITRPRTNPERVKPRSFVFEDDENMKRTVRQAVRALRNLDSWMAKVRICFRKGCRNGLVDVGWFVD